MVGPDLSSFDWFISVYLGSLGHMFCYFGFYSFFMNTETRIIFLLINFGFLCFGSVLHCIIPQVFCYNYTGPNLRLIERVINQMFAPREIYDKV